MAFVRYEQSASPNRLRGMPIQRGAQSGTPLWLTFLFGLPFIGIGVGTILIGTKIIQLKSGAVHVPYWVVTAAGFSFAAGGFLVWCAGWRQFNAGRRRKQIPTTDSDSAAAMADYAWNPRYFKSTLFAGAMRPLSAAIFLTVFLSIFNWLGFGKGDVLFMIVAGLFDLFALFLWGLAFMTLGRAFKFGPSKIEFARFPYRVDEPIVLRWLTPTGLKPAEEGTFTLRCVKEWWEAAGKGRVIAQEELWSGSWVVAPQSDFPAGKSVELKFETPGHLPATRLSAGQIYFWELEIILSQPGLDFKEKYLVPVYGKP